jgi:tryptophanyl-tRNA synthetase
MSASVDSSAIFMKDDSKQIKNKINRYAFSGGQVSEQEQREKGGDADKDVSFQYLTFFLEDDAELEQIRQDYTSGKMLTGELKAKCIAELEVYVKAFQKRRAAVTDEDVADFMALKKLEWKGNPNPIAVEGGKVGEEETVVKEGEGKLTKNQEKKWAKMKMVEEKKAKEKAEKEAAKNKS